MKGRAMNIKFNHGWMHLSKHKSLHIVDGKGTRMVVRSGLLWVTQDRDRNDYVLNPGDVFDLDRAGDAIVFAFVPSEIELQEPRPSQHREPGAMRMIAKALDFAGKWIAQRFGVPGVAARNPRCWGNAI
jgi:hypothetical protein